MRTYMYIYWWMLQAIINKAFQSQTDWITNEHYRNAMKGQLLGSLEDRHTLWAMNCNQSMRRMKTYTPMCLVLDTVTNGVWYTLHMYACVSNEARCGTIQSTENHVTFTDISISQRSSHNKALVPTVHLSLHAYTWCYEWCSIDIMLCLGKGSGDWRTTSRQMKCWFSLVKRTNCTLLIGILQYTAVQDEYTRILTESAPH